MRSSISALHTWFKGILTMPWTRMPVRRQLWRKAGNWKSEIVAHLAEIEANRQRWALQRGHRECERSDRPRQRKGRHRGTDQNLNSLTSVYSAAGEPELAIETQQKLLELEPSTDDTQRSGIF